MIGAAGLARVDGRGPLIQRCVLAFMRNVAEAVLLRGTTLHRVRSQAALHGSLWGRVLRLEEGRQNKPDILLKLSRQRGINANRAVPSLTPGFTGSGTCGMLGRFGDATAAGAPMSRTAKQTQNVSACKLRRWSCSFKAQLFMRTTRT